jgi:hypothetical protein
MYKPKPKVMKPCKFCGKENPNRVWCDSRCSSAAWRKAHPYKTQKVVTEKICGFDHQNRDFPDKWKSYMKKNPIYYEILIRG